MKILIAYYPAAGPIEELARQIKKKLSSCKQQVDLIAIKPLKKHTWWGWLWWRLVGRGCRFSPEAAKIDAQSYDVICLGAPNWIGLPVPVVSYLTRFGNLQSKRVFLFTASFGPPRLGDYLFYGTPLKIDFEQLVMKQGGLFGNVLTLSKNFREYGAASRYGRTAIDRFTEKITTSEEVQALREGIRLDEHGIRFGVMASLITLILLSLLYILNALPGVVILIIFNIVIVALLFVLDFLHRYLVFSRYICFFWLGIFIESLVLNYQDLTSANLFLIGLMVILFISAFSHRFVLVSLVFLAEIAGYFYYYYKQGGMVLFTNPEADLFFLSLEFIGAVVIAHYLGNLHHTEKTIKYRLEESLHSLEARVQNRTAELAELNHNLEKIVAERTAELVQSRDKTLAVIDSMTDGILIFDFAQKLISVNASATKILKTNKRALALILKVLGKKSKKVHRKQVTLDSGSVVEVSALSISSSADILGRLIVLHDITREKEIESMKTEFVSIAAHQLRTPLTTIKWSLHLLMKESQGPITASQRELLERTNQHNERMIGLVNYLLDVTRLEQGRFIIKSSAVDFLKLVDKVILSRAEAISQKKIKFIYHRPRSRELTGNLDGEKIELVLQNLLDNAINYTPASGRITMQARYDKKESEMRMTVSDTGIGIPPANMKRIFSKFFRAENAILTQTQGSGLGLFITKNIITGHGGRIWFESTLGKGTTFYFTLPLKAKKN